MILPAPVITDQRMRPSTGSILILKKSDIILGIMSLLKVFINTNLSPGHTASTRKDSIDLILCDEALLLDINRVR